MGISWGSYPTIENTRMELSGTERMYLPLRSVVVPNEVLPFTVTETPDSTCSAVSVTVPFTSISCAIERKDTMPRKSKQSNFGLIISCTVRFIKYLAGNNYLNTKVWRVGSQFLSAIDKLLRAIDLSQDGSGRLGMVQDGLCKP